MKIAYEFIYKFWKLGIQSTAFQSKEVALQNPRISASPDFLNPVAMVLLYMALALACASTIKCLATGGSAKEALIRLGFGIIMATVLVSLS